MATETKNSLKFKSQEGPKGPPKGAEILSKEINIDVEEIENGFLIVKRTEYRFKVSKEYGSDYLTVYKKWYVEENPLELNGNKELADLFN